MNSRRWNSSHEIARQNKANAAKISKAITTAKLIGLSPLGQGYFPATQRLLNPFWQDTRGTGLGRRRIGGPLCKHVVDIVG